VKGNNLITLHYTGSNGRRLPVNFRVYDKSEGKAKNDYFRDMLEELLALGLEPAFVTGDSGHSGVDNLRRVKNTRWGGCSPSKATAPCVAPCIPEVVRGQRPLDTSAPAGHQQNPGIPGEVFLFWFNDLGPVKLFRTWLKDQPRHYAVFLPDDGPLADVERKTIAEQHDRRWHIEQHHRAIKQVCNRVVYGQRAAKPPSETTCSPPCVAMSRFRNSAPCP